MDRRTLTAKLVATGLILSVQALFIPTFAAEPTATVQGSILSATDQAPLAGARLHLGDPQTGKVHTSQPAQTDGSFAPVSVPAATYQVAVESSGGLFVVDTPLKLAPGQSQSVNLAINPQAAPDPETAKASSGKQGFWNNPLTAALVVLGAAVVVGLAVESATDDDNPNFTASPSGS